MATTIALQAVPCSEWLSATGRSVDVNCAFAARRGGLRLTARETQVLGLLTEGKGTNEIADLLFISTATVRNHIKNLLSKLNVHSRLEAVSLAQRVGLLDSIKDEG